VQDFQDPRNSQHGWERLDSNVSHHLHKREDFPEWKEKQVKYKHQRELVEGLRKLADFIEDHPELPINDPGIKLDFWVYADYAFQTKRGRSAKEKMATAAKAFGKAKKEYTSNWFDLSRNFGPIILEFTTSRSNVCRPVVKEVIEHPEEIVPQHVKPARTEEVIEWICDDPLLSAS
jgi:hypothetical protein